MTNKARANLPGSDKSPGRATDALWADVRARYESGSDTVAAIVADQGVTHSTLYERAKREGWRRRSRSPARDGGGLARMVAQLQRIAEELGRTMTARTMEVEGGGNAQGVDGQRLDDIERSAKLLQSLIRSVEALARLASRGEAKDGAKSTAGPDGAEDDAVTSMRRELERRLDRAVACR